MPRILGVRRGEDQSAHRPQLLDWLYTVAIKFKGVVHQVLPLDHPPHDRRQVADQVLDEVVVPRARALGFLVNNHVGWPALAVGRVIVCPDVLQQRQHRRQRRHRHLEQRNGCSPLAIERGIARRLQHPAAPGLLLGAALVLQPLAIGQFVLEGGKLPLRLIPQSPCGLVRFDGRQDGVRRRCSGSRGRQRSDVDGSTGRERGRSAAQEALSRRINRRVCGWRAMHAISLDHVDSALHGSG